tara:strand:- start:103 stop:276 length:174 start_codon:yes stop_codon:yes gene_type:complete
MNDKEKLQKILNMVEKLITSREHDLQDFVISDQPDKTELVQHNLDDLQKIKFHLRRR